MALALSSTRAHPRFAVEIDAELRVDSQKIPARTRNISRGGLALTTSQPLPIGTLVSVSLSLVFDEQAMSEPLPLQGRVVWSSPVSVYTYQLGVMFVAVRSEERSYVDMFIRFLRQ